MSITPPEMNLSEVPVWQSRALQRCYYGRPGWIDGTTEFHQMCSRYLIPAKPVLEIGAGRTNATSLFLKNQFGEVHGLDIAPDVQENIHLAKAFVYDGGRMPFLDAAYYNVVFDYVGEHIENPAQFLSEARRILKPAGVVALRTPNIWHPIGFAAAITPHWIHIWLVKHLKNIQGCSGDPFETSYCMNSRKRLRRLFRAARFEEVEIRMVEKEPSYGMSSRLLFHFLMAYERIVNSCDIFAGFRVNIFAVFRAGRDPENGLDARAR